MRLIRLVVSVAALAAVSGLAAPTPPKRGLSAASDLATIRTAGVIKIAIAGEETPPFVYRDASGKRAGLDVELAESIAEKLGVRVEWVTSASSSYSGVFDTLAGGKADLALSALFPTLDRIAAARFTTPYIRVKQLLFIHRLRATAQKLPIDYEGIVARKGLAFGYFPEAGGADGLLRREIDAKWVAFSRTAPGAAPPRDRMIAEFAKGELTGALIDEIELEKWRRTRPDIDVYGFAVEIPDGELPVSIAVRRDRPDLLEWTNLFVEQARRGNTLRRLLARHRAAAAKAAP